MLTDKQKSCHYCHQQSSHGKFRGARAHTKTDFYDWHQHKTRKRVTVSIISPENKRPRLQATTWFHTGRENNFDLPINFCPWCGRPLHVDPAEQDFTDFVDNYYANVPATQKQLEFISVIAEALSLEQPQKLTKQLAQQWISQHIDDWREYTATQETLADAAFFY
ncbi:hypothetical protein ACEN34_00590 [Loigolactobacillus zhaoyuanensis]|uniref:Uncharacterized protein n=1 Tax=Loigolactobacillus zhaoyuanensis TaxID=2486017 RepID=A0ABW8U8X2_9LACO